MGRSGSRQKFAKKAESMKQKIPKNGINPYNGSTVVPIIKALPPIKIGMMTGAWPPWAKPAIENHLTLPKGLDRLPKLKRRLFQELLALQQLLLLLLQQLLQQLLRQLLLLPQSLELSLNLQR